MKYDIQLLEYAKKSIADLIKAQRNVIKKQEAYMALDWNNTTHKRRENANMAMISASEERNTIAHHTHCAVVNAGLAPAYSEDYYGEREEHPTAWQRVNRLYEHPHAHHRRDDVIHILENTVELSVVYEARRFMVCAISTGGEDGHERFVEAQLTVADEHAKLNEAGYYSVGMDMLESALYNQPEWIHPKDVTPDHIYDVHKRSD